MYQKKASKYGRSSSARLSMLRSLLMSLVKNKDVETTLCKARGVRVVVEKAITAVKRKSMAPVGADHRGRNGTLRKFVHNNDVMSELSALAERYKDRRGGYTRIIKTRFRSGDFSAMARVQFV